MSEIFQRIQTSYERDHLSLRLKSCDDTNLQTHGLFDRYRLLLKNTSKDAVILLHAKNHPASILFLISALEHGNPVLLVDSSYPKNKIKELIDALEVGLYVHFENDIKITEFTNYRKHEQINTGIIFCTSGTSGVKNKLIFHNEQSLLTNAQTAAKEQIINTSSIILSQLSFCHSGGFGMQLLPGLISGSHIFLRHKKTKDWLKRDLKNSISHTILVPSQIRSLLMQDNYNGNGCLALTGSSPVSSEDFNVLKKQNFKPLAVYGLTEIGPFVATSWEAKKFSAGHYANIGKAQNGYQIKLSSNQEILIKGPCVGKIYNHDSKTWEPTASKDGWVATGDIGIQESGLIAFVGRKNLTINFSGFKINPYEIESLVRDCDGVKDCSLTYKSSNVYGQIPVLYILGDKSSLPQIKSHLRQNLHTNQLPRSYHFVDQLSENYIHKSTKII